MEIVTSILIFHACQIIAGPALTQYAWLPIVYHSQQMGRRKLNFGMIAGTWPTDPTVELNNFAIEKFIHSYMMFLYYSALAYVWGGVLRSMSYRSVLFPETSKLG